MSHSSAHTNHGRHNHRNGPAKRPSSIAELAEKAKDDGWDETKEFKQHLRIAEKYRKEGKECLKRGDLEGAFVELARAATLVLERLPSHRDYNTMLNASQRHNLSLNGQDILDNLSDLKPALVDRYEKWLQRHGADVLDQERTPNARTQKIANDEARAQAQREQFQEEERTREQQRMAAEEAAKWKQQRQQMFARDEAEKARRKEAAQAAARQAANAPNYTFARTPMQNNALGSQSTVVLADGRPPDEIARQQQYQQQQEQMRLREEEITRRQAEQKRKLEGGPEGIARRQQEAEDAARAARQNLGNGQPPTPSSSVSLAPSTSSMFPTYNGSSAATTPSSTYFPPPPPSGPIEYPTIHPPSGMQLPVPSAPPDRQAGYLDPYANASRPMPLESPTRYDGESTDSESVHHDYRKVGKPRGFIEYKTPTRPVRRYVRANASALRSAFFFSLLILERLDIDLV
ncbi:hypothetical protein GALMADRAFT_1148554 [Galerina marginata CBS 339.88]|uniref:USP8 dimerisation domain-containing protein n=1 Tax=Galerina marginata (strain CBS 339.88) TaxID=685588 RepID=A0A067SFA8_GALM3|nr:hypothetical protein GALMADRAFT_1148554 [Galerina marginata CBS 339.88]